MKFLHALAIAALLAAGTPALAASPPSPMEAVRTMRLEGWVVIGTDGSVADYAITSAADPQLLASLDRNVRQWRFAPVVMAGAPVVARANFRLTLAARILGDRAEVRVDNLLFPDAVEEAEKAPAKGPVTGETPGARVTVVSMRPPQYPTNLERAGVAGRVLLALRLGLDGRVADAQVVQTVLFDVRGRDNVMQKVAEQLEGNALGKARGWRFAVQPKSSAPSAADLTVTVPVTYTFSRDPFPPGKWRAEVRGVHRDISWLPPRRGQPVAGASDLESGEPMPVASNVEIRDGVIGQLLL